MIRVLVILSVLVMLGPASPRPQRPTGFAQRKAMRNVQFLVGTWAGEGWVQMGRERRTFHGTETVEKKLGGAVLLIEGQHKAQMPGVDAPVTVHHALAVLSWDQQAQHYLFQSWLADGRSGDYEASVENGAFRWSMSHPERGRMRYVIRLDDAGRWHETGEINPPGTDVWRPFFEMTLSRVKG